ncbi:4564_t:CDS:2 [Entrophospora sp. SA101]|nr:4564_t:CDS:2 [Entrophospora sp. SA101]
MALAALSTYNSNSLNMDNITTCVSIYYNVTRYIMAILIS